MYSDVSESEKAIYSILKVGAVTVSVQRAYWRCAQIFLLESARPGVLGSALGVSFWASSYKCPGQGWEEGLFVFRRVRVSVLPWMRID